MALSSAGNDTLSEISEELVEIADSYPAEIVSCFLLTTVVITFSCCSLAVFLWSPLCIRANFENPTGFLMTWLSVNDFITGFVLLVPMTITVTFHHRWMLGGAFCGIQGFVLQLVQNSTNALLMSAAVDRFCALVLPIKYVLFALH